MSIEINETKIDGLYVRKYVSKKPVSPQQAVLFLHGYPGSQKNYDIAEHLALNGFHCYVMHYRGAWKSEGQYSLISIYPDVELILGKIREDGFSESQTSLLGSSWGGFVALEMAAKHTSFFKVILLAPYINLDHDEQALLEGADFMSSVTKPAIKNYEKDQLLAELRVVQKEYNPVDKVDSIDGSKVLILHGVNDQICPIEQTIKLKKSFKNPARLVKLPQQDHFLHTREIIYGFCHKFLKSRLV